MFIVLSVNNNFYSFNQKQNIIPVDGHNRDV